MLLSLRIVSHLQYLGLTFCTVVRVSASVVIIVVILSDLVKVLKYVLVIIVV